jgi:hypothetical protein
MLQIKEKNCENFHPAAALVKVTMKRGKNMVAERARENFS